MASVYDVAAYILRKQGTMTAMKLQKLVYYSQAWSLVWDERPLFPQTIKAWVNGPVVPDLYNHHMGRFRLDPGHFGPRGDPEALTADERETVDAVLGFYGDKNAQWLSDLTHLERPWKEARSKATSEDNKQSPIITTEAMAEYYGSLPPFSTAP